MSITPVISPTPLPTDANADVMREYNRRNAERQAVKDLAFDPLVDKK